MSATIGDWGAMHYASGESCKICREIGFGWLLIQVFFFEKEKIVVIDLIILLLIMYLKKIIFNHSPLMYLKYTYFIQHVKRIAWYFHCILVFSLYRPENVYVLSVIRLKPRRSRQCLYTTISSRVVKRVGWSIVSFSAYVSKVNARSTGEHTKACIEHRLFRALPRELAYIYLWTIDIYLYIPHTLAVCFTRCVFVFSIIIGAYIAA